MKNLDRHQESRNASGPLSENGLHQLINNWNGSHSKDNGKQSQLSFGVAEMNPTAQEEVVKSHICRIPEQSSHECVPISPGKHGAGGLVEPETPLP
jgi:hypothetical protein